MKKVPPLDVELGFEDQIPDRKPEDKTIVLRNQQTMWFKIWGTASKAWSYADKQLASLFGLDESKYEWAVRDYYYQERHVKEQLALQEAEQRKQEEEASQRLGTQETIPAQDSMARDDEEESTIQPLEAVKVEKPQVSQPSRLEDVPV